MGAGLPASLVSRRIADAVVDDMGAQLDEIAHTLSRGIHASISQLDEDLYMRTFQSVRANLGIIRAMLAEGTRPSVATPPPEALAYATEYVHRGLGLELLQRAYRVAQADLTQIWLHDIHERAGDADELAETFGFFNDWLFGWVEALEARLMSYYSSERDRWLRSASAVRAHEVRALLDGGPVDARSASARLRYELDRRHVALIVWPDGGDGGHTDGQMIFGAMEKVAGSLSELLGGVDHVTVPLGQHLACWVGFRSAPATENLPSLLSGAARCGLHVSLGEQGFGVEGFRRSYKQAMLARGVARLGGRVPGSCVRFTDVALDVLLTHDQDEARRFVEQELGDLAEDNAAARRLRATAALFLDENGSFRHAAERLGVHENTVAYRIRRCEELLGRSVRERQLELRTALRLAHLLG
jgi:hypothetical protein